MSEETQQAQQEELHSQLRQGFRRCHYKIPMTTLEQIQSTLLERCPTVVSLIGKDIFFDIISIAFESGRLEGRQQICQEQKGYLDSLSKLREQGNEL